jgi:hypothetical protein
VKLASMLLAGAFVCAPVLAVAQSVSSPSSGDYDGAYYKRQLYVVTNMERALTLWRDVLGLQPGEITISGPNSYSREVFNIPARATMRFCTLSALLEVKGVRLPAKNGIRTTGAVINANGRLDAIIGSARTMGLTIFGPRVLTSQGQGEGIEQGFLDWDGNVIVLYQFPNADAPSRR